MEDLKLTLKDWDGRATELLQISYAQYVHYPDFISILTDWSIQNIELQNASTWLLKHHLDQKNTLSRRQTVALLPALAVAKEWPALLHILQMLPKLPLAEPDVEVLLEPIEILLQDKIKFVKAWAYYALGLLTQFVPELRSEVEEIYQLGLENESAAIKSRIRRACKDFKMLG